MPHMHHCMCRSCSTRSPATSTFHQRAVTVPGRRRCARRPVHAPDRRCDGRWWWICRVQYLGSARPVTTAISRRASLSRLGSRCSRHARGCTCIYVPSLSPYAPVRRVTNRQLHAPPELHVKVLGQMEVKDCGCEHCANCSEYLAPREHYEDYEVLGNLWDGTSGKCCDVHRDRRSTKPWPLTIS